MTATARILQAARKMTPGTFMGQSRSATPCDCNKLLEPYGVSAPVCCYEQMSRYLPDYEPAVGEPYATPVQVGSVYNLCPAFTCEGGDYALLGWVDRTANEYRIAKVSPTGDMFEDDSVTMGDVRIAWSSGSRTIHTGCISVIDNALYLFVSSILGTNGLIECYIANDVENPTSWNFRGTIQTHTSPSPFASSSVRNAGPPTVTADGLWILPFHGFTTFAASALEDAVSIHTSADHGATWTTHFTDRKGALFSGTAGPQSTTVTYDPYSNRYVFGSHMGPVTQWRVYTSPTGTTWTQQPEINDSIDPFFFVHTGVYLYAARLIGTNLNLYRVGDPLVYATWTDLGITAMAGTTSIHDDGIQIIPMISSCGHHGIVLTMKDKITRTEVISVHGTPTHGGGSGIVGGGGGGSLPPTTAPPPTIPPTAPSPPVAEATGSAYDAWIPPPAGVPQSADAEEAEATGAAYNATAIVPTEDGFGLDAFGTSPFGGPDA